MSTTSLRPPAESASHQLARERFGRSSLADKYPSEYSDRWRDRREKACIVSCLSAIPAGSHVLDLPCGTGRLTRMLVERGYRVTSADASEAMLGRARTRAARHGWSNVELVQSDAASYEFPASVDGVLSTYTLVILPEYDRVIERACRALKEGKRCVVLDQKLPSGPASRLVPLLDLLSRPLDYSRIVGERRLWESIQRHAGNVRVEELYFGFVYLAVGEKNAAGARPRH